MLDSEMIVDVHHVPATMASTVAYTMSPPVSEPISATSVSRQLASTNRSASEYLSTVSSNLALAAVASNY